MALDPSNSSKLEQLALKGLTIAVTFNVNVSTTRRYLATDGVRGGISPKSRHCPRHVPYLHVTPCINVV